MIGYSVTALALSVLAGCQKTAAPAEPAAADGGSRRVASHERSGRSHAQRDHAGPRGRDDPRSRPRLSHRAPFRGRCAVQKGQLLLVIDEEPYKVALQSARARQAEAAAALKKAEESKGREVAAAQVELDRAQLLLAQIQERRSRRCWRATPARPRTWTRPRPTASKWESQVEADLAHLAPGKGRLRGRDRLGAGPGRGRQGRGPRRRAEPGLLPDGCPARRPDRRGQGQGRQPGRARVQPAAVRFSELATIQQLDPMGVDIRLSSRDLDRIRHLIQEGWPSASAAPAVGRAGTSLRGERATSSTTRSTRRLRRFWPRPASPTPAGCSCRASTSRCGWSSTGSKMPSWSRRRRSIETDSGTVVHVVDGQGKVAVRTGRRGAELRGAARHRQGARLRRAGDRRRTADDPPRPRGQDRAGGLSPRGRSGHKDLLGLPRWQGTRPQTVARKS